MLIGPQNLTLNVNHVRSRINEAAKAAGRDPASVTLVAVTKAKAAESMREAATAGVTDFGENYLQEALGKMDALAGLPPCAGISSAASSRTRPGAVAERFDWVHSVDRSSVARRLVGAAPLSCAAAQRLHPGRPGAGAHQGRGRAREIWRELAAADGRAAAVAVARADVRAAAAAGCGAPSGAVFARLRAAAREL